MEMIVLALQIILGILLFLGFLYIRRLPERLHAEGQTRYEYSLKSDLAKINAGLERENELLTIRYQESQSRKAIEYIEFLEYFNSIWTDRQAQAEIKGDSDKKREFNQKMVSLGVRLFIFGSDEVLKKYLAFRSISQEDASGDPKDILRRLGELILQMRRDLLHPDTECTADDLLKTFIVDWKS